MNRGSVLLTLGSQEPMLKPRSTNTDGGTKTGTLFQALLLKNAHQGEKADTSDMLETADIKDVGYVENWSQFYPLAESNGEFAENPSLEDLSWTEALNWTQDEMQ